MSQQPQPQGIIKRAAAPAPAAVRPAAPVPSARTMYSAASLALRLNNNPPISLDYWADSLNNRACIGVNKAQKDAPKDKQEKKLYKNSEEHTSLIKNIYPGYQASAGEAASTEFLVVTENTIYITSSTIGRSYVVFPADEED